MDEQIYITIAKALSNEASDTERRELNAWLQEDSRNQDVYEDMKRLWNETDVLVQGPEFESNAAWEKVAAKTIMVEGKKKPRTIAFPQWLKLSAVAAVLVIGFLGYNLLKEGSTEQIVADNTNKIVVLPDHSTVTLKKGSSLSYPRKFALNERKVSLKGEAFFEVTRNEKQPFVIDARSINVRVLGTSFDVSSDDTSATVVVATGRVQVTTSKKNGAALVLTPGKQGNLSNGSLQESLALNGGDLYWKTGQLNFTDQPLNKVVAVMSKAKDTIITVDASLPLDQQQQLVTISFSKQSVEEMLTELCLITHTRWVRDNNHYIIKPK